VSNLAEHRQPIRQRFAVITPQVFRKQLAPALMPGRAVDECRVTNVYLAVALLGDGRFQLTTKRRYLPANVRAALR